LITQENLKNFLKNLFILNFIFIVLFGRSYTGLIIFNFRLGEIIVGFLILVSLIILVLYLYNKKIFENISSLALIFSLIIISFLISLFINNGNIFNLYSLKTSSYIWIISLFFFLYLSKKYFYVDLKLDKFLPYLLFLVYILSTIYYPEFLINIFQTFSDKFEFAKASDIFLIYVFTNISNFMNFQSKFNALMYLFFSSAVLIPLFLFMSKGSFFPSVLFFVLVISISFEIIKRNKLKTLFIFIFSIFLFAISTYEVFGNLTFEKSLQSIEEEELLDLNSFADKLSNIAKEKNTTIVFGSLYISENRIYSEELMLNWRLQIWQDIFYDAVDKNELFFGQGYNSIIRSMDVPDRKGTDGTNENVHNYFMNIFARAGFLQLFLFLGLIYFIYRYSSNQSKKYLLITLLCIYLTSSFDANMESVRFPFIFYTLLSAIFQFNIASKYQE
tara:strand:- start:5868 stop:7202 length:1335 start_codon:yes stop_codon:yes gene_type:complete